jgi:hypothetical protein
VLLICNGSNADPNPVPDPDTKFWLKMAKTAKKTCFLIKIAIYFSPGINEGGSSYRRSLQPSKKEHPELKNI